MLTRVKAFLPILFLTFGHGAVDSYVGLLQAVAPGAAEYLNVPLGDIVLLIGIGTLVNNMIQPYVGHIMGKRNLAWALWVSVVVSSLPCLMGWVSGYWGLVALVLLGGIGTGVYHPEAVLSASDAAGDKAYLGVPLFMSGGAAIYALFTPVAIWMSEGWGFPSLALLIAPGLLVGAFLYFEYRKKRLTHPSIVIRPRSKRVTIVTSGVVSFWPLLAMGLCFCIGNGLFLATVASHFELEFGSGARNWSGYTLMVLGIGGSAASFFWSWLSRKYNFYGVALVTQLIAAPLFLLMMSPSSPELGFLIAIPLGLVAPAAVHPVAVLLSRNAAGSTQAMRTSLMIGFAYGMSSLAIMLAGVVLRQGVPSGYLLLFIACCSVFAAVLAFWQYLATRKTGVHLG